MGWWGRAAWWWEAAKTYGAVDEAAAACDAAHDDALDQMLQHLLAESETRSDIIAATGGPSRFERSMAAFVEKDAVRAVRMRSHFEPRAGRCWVELRWLLPRNLAGAVRRAVEGRATEEDVALEMKRALLAGDGESEEEARPVVAKGRAGAATPFAAANVVYPGWFVRVLDVTDCPTHRMVFVGAPGGDEARWVEVKRSSSGWIVVGDQRVPNEGWPVVPAIVSCE